MDIVIVIVFLILGIAFLLLEIFFLPGLSFGAIFGFGFIVASVWYAFGVLGSTAGWITLIGGVAVFGLAMWGFIKSKTLDKISLHSEIQSKVTPVNNGNVQVGDRGETISRLAPIGKVRIGKSVYEAKSFEGFIDSEVAIVVVSATENSIIVRPLSQDTEI